MWPSHNLEYMIVVDFPIFNPVCSADAQGRQSCDQFWNPRNVVVVSPELGCPVGHRHYRESEAKLAERRSRAILVVVVKSR
jgi:hypothetical protein